jgi:hypothetical protein
MVRARCGVDIENYRDHHTALPSMTEPTSDEARGYRWRVSVSFDDWVKLAGRLAEQVTYGNFKRACHERNKTLAYGKVWLVLADVQRDEHCGDAASHQSTTQQTQRGKRS